MTRLNKGYGRIGAAMALAVSAGWANAHVSVTSGMATAGHYYQVDLAIPHGCDGADTERLVVQIPAALSGVRPVVAMDGDDSGISVEIDSSSGEVATLTYLRSQTRADDDMAYTVSFRGKLADVPFTTLHFPTTQHCVGGLVSAWVGTGGHHHHGGDAGDSDALPAPALFVYPQRHAGWNQYTAPDHLHDMSIFGDAEIVWKGNAAYSPNPAIMQLIEADEDSAVLSEIHPEETIWVKY